VCSGTSLSAPLQGVKLFNHLIKFVYSLNDDKNESISLEHRPDLFQVQEWQFKDIVKIKNPNICKEFEYACQEELETLWYRGSFKRVKKYLINKLPIKYK